MTKHLFGHLLGGMIARKLDGHVVILGSADSPLVRADKGLVQGSVFLSKLGRSLVIQQILEPKAKI
jgi:hypothetical protein